jgi:SAM-dependent methyltransferase
VIPQGVFDVIICLDVLEHVVSPLSVISDMVAYLKPQGQAIISESFGEIVPLKPTHLRTNLRHAGRTLSLFRRSGFAYEETFCGRLYRFSRAGSGWEPLKRLQEMRDGARLEAIGAIAKVQFWRHFGTKEIDVERALREAVGDLADDLLVAKS